MSYIENKANEEQKKKAEQWKALKEIAPDEAERIKAFGDAFGKLEKLRVEVDGFVIVNWG